MARTAFSALDQAARLFADTSYFFAVLDPGDRHHAVATALAQEVAARRLPLVTTWEVVVECVALLRYRLGFRESEEFLTEIVSTLRLYYPTEADRTAAVDLYLKRGAGRKLSLCDAISYVVVSARLDWAPCLSFDDDFAALGLTVVR